jgi:hypothetical protein
MAFISRDAKFLIFLAVIAIIINVIPFYVLLRFGKP